MKKILKFLFLGMILIISSVLIINTRAEEETGGVIEKTVSISASHTSADITQGIIDMRTGDDQTKLLIRDDDFFHKNQGLPVTNGQPDYPFELGYEAESLSGLVRSEVGNEVVYTSDTRTVTYGGMVRSGEFNGETKTLEQVREEWNTNDVVANRWVQNGNDWGEPTLATSDIKGQYYAIYSHNLATGHGAHEFSYGTGQIKVKMTLVDFEVIENGTSISAITFYSNKIGAAVTGIKWLKVRFDFLDSNNQPVSIKGNTTFWDVDLNQGVIITRNSDGTGLKGVYYGSGAGCDKCTKCVGSDASDKCDTPTQNVDNQLYLGRINSGGSDEVYYIYDQNSGSNNNLYDDKQNSSVYAFTVIFEGTSFETYFQYSDPVASYGWNGHGGMYLSPDTVTEKYKVEAVVTNGQIQIEGVDKTPSGNDWFDVGTDVTVTYQPNAGYALKSIIIDNVEQTITDANRESYTFPNIDANHDIVVEYERVFTVTATAINGTIQIDGETVGRKDNIPEGSNVAITYSANSGYKIHSITVDGNPVTITSTNRTSYTFPNIDGNHDIVVEFKKVYKITTTVEPTSCATITPTDSSVFEGNSKIINYSVKDEAGCEGYYIKEIKIDGDPIEITESNRSSYTFENVRANRRIDVVYIKKADKPLKAVKDEVLTIDDEVVFEISQKVDPKEAAYYSNFVIEDVLDDAFIIDQDKIVVIDKNGTHVTNKFDITVTGQKVTVSAKNLEDDTFYDNIYTLIMNVKINDEVLLDEDGAVVEEYIIDDKVMIVNRAKVTIDNNEEPTNIVGVEVKAYTITTDVENGTIDPTPSIIVPEGRDALIIYFPNTGYVLKSITVDGEKIQLKGNEEYYEFEDVDDDHDIKVVYDVGYTITTEAVNGTIDPEVVVLAGEDITITYKPNSGYEINELIIDGESIKYDDYKNSYEFKNVDSNHTIKVVYIKNEKTGLFEFGIFGTIIVALCAFGVYKFITNKKQIREI